MNLKFWKNYNLNKWLKRPKGKLGTPENPEIIEPGQIYRRPGQSTTKWQAPRLFMTLILPAIFLDWICIGLIDMGMNSGSVVAWLLLLILAPPALMATFIAFITGATMTLFVILSLFAKPLGR